MSEGLLVSCEDVLQLSHAAFNTFRDNSDTLLTHQTVCHAVHLPWDIQVQNATFMFISEGNFQL